MLAQEIQEMKVSEKSFIIFHNEHLFRKLCKNMYVGVSWRKNEIEGALRTEKFKGVLT